MTRLNCWFLKTLINLTVIGTMVSFIDKLLQKRMAKYSKQDIVTINAKQEKIYQDLATLMPLGVEDEKVQGLVHQARMLINDNWYDCSKQQFQVLGKMYVSDARFQKNIDKHGKGLAEFLSQSVEVYVKG